MNRRYFIGILLSCIVLLALYTLTYAQNPSITNYELVNKRRSDRTMFDYTYRADFVNNGPARQSVIARVTSSSADTVIIEGTLNFGDVPANSTVRSNDTFTLRHDRTVPFDFGVLVWEFTEPQPPVLEAIPDQTVSLGSTLTLQFRANDPNDDALIFSATPLPPPENAILDTGFDPKVRCQRCRLYL